MTQKTQKTPKVYLSSDRKLEIGEEVYVFEVDDKFCYKEIPLYFKDKKYKKLKVKEPDRFLDFYDFHFRYILEEI